MGNKVSGKFEFSSHDIKSLWADLLIYFIPVGVLALNQLQNTWHIDEKALYGLFISLAIKAWKKYMTNYKWLLWIWKVNLENKTWNKPWFKKIKLKKKNEKL
jgi:hypothetical protein